MRRWLSVVVLGGFVSVGCATTRAGHGSTPDCPVPCPAEPQLEDPAGSFARAVEAGALDEETCQRHARAFDQRFARSGKPDDRFNAAVVWDTCGQPTQATAAYRDVVRIDPRHAMAHNNLGVLAFRAGRTKDALRHYTRAVEAVPTAIPPRHNLAHLHRARFLETGNTAAFDAAQRQLQAVLAVDSENLAAYEGLARLYYDRAAAGDRSYALLAGLVITQAQRSKTVNGTASAPLWNLRGLLAALDEEPTRALRSFQRATELDPDFVDARLNAALIELELRNFAQAEKDLEAAAKSAEGDRAREVALALGVAKRGVRDFEGAEKAYARAVQHDRDDPRALFNMGVLYQDHIGPAVASDGVREVEIAKSRFQAFVDAAGDRPDLREAVAVAQRRISTIDEYVEIIDDSEQIEREAARLEALQREQEREERARILELERKAQDALERSQTPTPPDAD